MSGESPGDEGGDDPKPEIVPWADSLDRFERELDIQINTLDIIDDKAQQTARIIAVLLGLVLTAIPLTFRFIGPRLAGSLLNTPAFGLGIAGLVAALIGAIITYLSSRFDAGLDPAVADGLATYDVSPEQYQALVLGAFASALEENRAVIRTNAFRFRLTLTTLIVGIVYFAGAAFSLGIEATNTGGWAILAVVTAIAIGTVIYIVSGRYLTIQN
jgi:uncharacterized protein YjeT (DUF2065 family)